MAGRAARDRVPRCRVRPARALRHRGGPVQRARSRAAVDGARHGLRGGRVPQPPPWRSTGSPAPSSCPWRARIWRAPDGTRDRVRRRGDPGRDAALRARRPGGGGGNPPRRADDGRAATFGVITALDRRAGVGARGGTWVTAARKPPGGAGDGRVFGSWATIEQGGVPRVRDMSAPERPGRGRRSSAPGAR